MTGRIYLLCNALVAHLVGAIFGMLSPLSAGVGGLGLLGGVEIARGAGPGWLLMGVENTAQAWEERS